MRKIVLIVLFITLLLLGVGCGKNKESITRTALNTSNDEEEENSLLLLGGPSQDSKETKDSEKKTSDKDKTKSTIYPPSIFVIEAAGGWQQELAAGYYANYECEFYADKLDELDNQSASGQYTGVFWMKVTLDTSEYLKDFLKNVPVEMEFDAGGEGICDYFNVVLMNNFERESMGGSYSIPDNKGKDLPPSKDALATRGSFITEEANAYLDVKASGAAGEKVEYHNNQSSNTEIEFVIHVAPDPDFTATERKVTIHLTSGDGMSGTIEGMLHRLPGYSEDLKAYTSKGKREEILNKHIQ